ncbi:MAG: glycoside hydrolase family 3 N-terminal domain-containing protein, partial [Firmicutes bacterium]|nr:glycoside hydrolase family 3 N-terminal domain-containing protein [Bacillota bacterium]
VSAALPSKYQRVLDSMTLEEKVGQMLVLGISGTYISSGVREVVTDLDAGGIVLFAYKLTSSVQTVNLTTKLQQEALQSKHAVPLLITADEEGGLVSRMPYGMVTMPGNMALGASRNEYLALKAYYHTGRQLKALGINMNLAPVLDVNNNIKNPVIGLRSFGSDPVLVSNMGVAALAGLKEAKVGSIVKHFPGHGDTLVDSHLALPIVKKTKAELGKMELMPFQKALQNGATAVMTAHISFPSLTNGVSVPATLSQDILTGVLRANWGYNGVISTDDMLMNAIVNHYGFKEAVVQAVKAGVDQILIASNLGKQKEAKKAIIDAVNRGEISESRINQSVERIFALKSELDLHPGKFPEYLDPLAEAKEAEDVAMEVALGAITILRNESRLLQKGDKILLVVVDHTLQGAGGRNNQKISQLMHVELASRGFDNLETVALGYRPSTTEQSLVISKAKNSDVVLYLTRNATNEQAEFIRKLADKLMITVALQNPWDILQYPDVKVYLATYGYTEASIKALAMVLTGEKDATGKLPIAISESFPYGYSN